jgi:CDP-diacylglycerol--glycerol-3-phosphate 3-phosphatidyltransferase
LILNPVLWALALLNLRVQLGILLAIAFATDSLDGYIARRFDLSTRFGSRLDSLADTLLLISAWIWLLLLEPEATIEHPWLFWGASLLSLTSMTLGLVKFGGLPNLHLYSTKVAGFTVSVFMVTTFIFEGYFEELFYVMIFFAIVGAVETILLQLFSRKIHENMGSLILAILKRIRTPEKAA